MINQSMNHVAPSALEIAAALQEISILLRIKGGRYFQSRAYESAARVVAALGDSVHLLVQTDQLRTISGIGHGIATQVDEFYRTGNSWLLDKLRSELPKGVIELSTVPGLSLKKIKLLQDTLGISSIDELKAAAEREQIRNVKGFGAKTEKKLLEAVIHEPEQRNELHIHKATRIANEILEYLQLATLKRIEIAGDIRRARETVSELVFVASSAKPADVLDHFTNFPMFIRTIERRKELCLALLNTGIKVTLIAVRPRDFASALLQATGSERHIERLTELTSTNALDGKQRSGEESDIYRRLGLQYIPPELREDIGEIEAAIAGELPRDLIELEDIRGMIHCHTNYSDGKHTIEEMARGADELGFEYLTITDHSPTAYYAGGLKVDRLYRQWDEIDHVQDRVKVKLLRGTESDILADGSLDYPDRILDQLDVIIASIHSRYKMDENQMTERITTAMRLPWFKIWGHALGRLIQHRPPFNCRMEEILDVLAESNAAVEVNSDPYRLDMPPEWIREARKRGIRFVISTDAHSINGMKNLKYGIGIARRGWVTRNEVLNSLGTHQFREAVTPTRYLQSV